MVLFNTKKEMLDNKLVSRILFFIKSGKNKFNQKALTFLFFLFLSVIFWVLNALDQNYTTTITYPVHYINFPANKVLMSNAPNQLNLRVTGHGYRLLRFKLNSRKTPIIFDIKSFSLDRLSGKSSSNYYLLTRLARERVSNQLGSDIQVSYISPDTLYFQFANVVTRKLPVKPNVQIDLAKQFMVRGIITSQPDSIMVSGPNVIMDTLRGIQTKPLLFKGIDAPVSKSVGLLEIDKVNFTLRKVNVIIPIERYTEGNLLVAISIQNQPDSLEIKLFPSSVKVTFNVALSDFTKVKPSMFDVFVDFQNTNNSLDNKLKVTMAKFPNFVSSVQQFPTNVEYIIEK